MSSLIKELNGVLATCIDAGADVEKRPNGHWAIKFPNGESVFTGSTPSDWRAVKNLKSEIRARSGLDLWARPKKKKAHKETKPVRAHTKTVERKNQKWRTYEKLAAKAGYDVSKMARDLAVTETTILRYQSGNRKCGVAESRLDSAVAMARADIAGVKVGPTTPDPVPDIAADPMPPNVNPGPEPVNGAPDADVEVSDGMVRVLGMVKVDLGAVLAAVPDDMLHREVARRFANPG